MIEYKTTAEVVVTYSPVVACASHHGGPHAPEVPPKPVDRGQMGFSLAARCLWLRTTHNLPVRRIAEMMQAEGVPLTEEMVHALICLETFLSDGHVAIDNSAAERGLRRITIGRKLWLFFRDQDKLDHVARLMSVVSTARLHGVDELAYLTWVLEQVARRTWSAQAATKLLPGAWAAMQEKPVQERAPG